MLSIKDKYEYNQKDLLDWNLETSVLTFKGRVKESPNEVVNITIIPNAYGKIYEEEVQKLESQEKDGLIAIMERIRNGQNFYLIFSNVIGTKADETQPTNFEASDKPPGQKLSHREAFIQQRMISMQRAEQDKQKFYAQENQGYHCQY